jgi:uncharacterized membrane protein YqhA
VEALFERFLWKLRLIAILPVIMSLTSTGVTFVLGTLEIGKSILGLSHAADAVPRMRSSLSAWPSCCWP